MFLVVGIQPPVGDWFNVFKTLAVADDFHPVANREKMASGIPLTDDDRAPWLAALNADGVDPLKDGNLVVVCSAL